MQMCYEEMTEREIEAYVNGIYDVLLELNVKDGYGKMYDPIDIRGEILHSYVFDLWDGGRHHNISGKSNTYICKSFVKEAAHETKSYFKEMFCEED